MKTFFAITLLVLVTTAFAQTQVSTGEPVRMIAGECSTENAQQCIARVGGNAGSQLGSYANPDGASIDGAVLNAMKALGKVRYVFGADPNSFDISTGTGVVDCSGFSKRIIDSSFGTTLPRTAGAQYDATKKNTVQFGTQRAGDLVFFRNTYNACRPGNEECISHVGIVVDQCRFIHAGKPTVKWGNLCSGFWAPGGRYFYAITRVA